MLQVKVSWLVSLTVSWAKRLDLLEVLVLEECKVQPRNQVFDLLLHLFLVFYLTPWSMGVSLTLVSKVTDLDRWQRQNVQCLKEKLNYCNFTTPGLLLSLIWLNSLSEVALLGFQWHLSLDPMLKVLTSFSASEFLPFLMLCCCEGDAVFWVWTGASSETIEISPEFKLKWVTACDSLKVFTQ